MVSQNSQFGFMQVATNPEAKCQGYPEQEITFERVQYGTSDDSQLPFNYRDTIDPLHHAMLGSTNLTEWTRWDSFVPGAVDVVTLTNNGNGSRVLQVPINAGADQLFLRLKVTAP